MAWFYPFGPSPEASELSDRTMSYWANFARQADPNGWELPSWPAYDLSDRAYLTLDHPTSQGNAFLGDECDFWDDYGKGY